jgi:hypothetical protein
LISLCEWGLPLAPALAGSDRLRYPVGTVAGASAASRFLPVVHA